MAAVEVLAETEVTTPNLAQVFKRAFFSTSVDSDGDLIVQSDGPRIIVRIDTEKKLVVFLMMLRIKEAASETTKLNLVNSLNSKLILARFAVPRPDVMTADCTLPFEEGIPTFQIVSTLRLFGRVVVGGVRAFDANDLVM